MGPPARPSPQPLPTTHVLALFLLPPPPYPIPFTIAASEKTFVIIFGKAFVVIFRSDICALEEGGSGMSMKIFKGLFCI